MKIKKSSVLKAVILLFVVALGYGMYRQFRGTEITIPSFLKPEAGTRLLMSLEGFTYIQSENGAVSWRLDTKSADLYENKEAKLKDVEIVFNNPGKGNVALIGETGTMDTASGDATIRGNSQKVRIVTSDGYVLTTNSLNWKAGERVVRTADPFKMLGREIYLEGRGLSARVENRTLTVDNNVKAILQE